MGFYGTFDMGGNVYEWNEAQNALERGLRGGSWNDDGVQEQISTSGGTISSTLEDQWVGLRVAAPAG